MRGLGLGLMLLRALFRRLGPILTKAVEWAQLVRLARLARLARDANQIFELADFLQQTNRHAEAVALTTAAALALCRRPRSLFADHSPHPPLVPGVGLQAVQWRRPCQVALLQCASEPGYQDFLGDGVLARTLRLLPHDGDAAVAVICKSHAHVHVLVRGHTSRFDGQSGDDSAPSESEEGSRSTMRLDQFNEMATGAVMRLEFGELGAQVPLAVGNAVGRKTLSAGVQMMKRGFHTRTHRDQYGVAGIVRNVAGRTWFIVWGREEGDTARLNDSTPEGDWDKRSTWSTLFGLASATFVLLGPGDQAVLRPGAYHRVFSLTTKVAAYWNHHDLFTVAEGAPSYSLDGGGGRTRLLEKFFVEALEAEARRSTITRTCSSTRATATALELLLEECRGVLWPSDVIGTSGFASGASTELSLLRDEVIDVASLAHRVAAAERGQLSAVLR